MTSSLLRRHRRLSHQQRPRSPVRAQRSDVGLRYRCPPPHPHNCKTTMMKLAHLRSFSVHGRELRPSTPFPSFWEVSGGSERISSRGLSGFKSMHAFCITVVGIAKLSPTLVQRATGAAVAGHGTGGGGSSPPPAFLSHWRDEARVVTRRSSCLLVMIVLLHISVRTG